MRSILSKIYFSLANRNRKVDELYDLYNKSQYWNKADMEKYQIKLFQNLWKHSIANVDYYKNFSKNNNIYDIKSLKDLESIPIMEKNNYNENINSFLAKNINKERFISNSTSGSTGSNFHFFNDNNTYRNSKALYMRRYKWMNLSIFKKELIIWGARGDFSNKSFSNKIKYYMQNLKIISGYKLSDKDFKNIHRLIQREKFDIINSYPSVLDKMVDIFRKNNFRVIPKAIVIGGEKLYLDQKNKIKEYFGAPIYDFYGARDMPNIAQSCNYDNGLHIFSENVIVEVVDENNIPIKEGEGDLVITNLHNYAMPFIRYKIGDRAKISKYKVCNCNRTLPLLDEVIGRKMELITFPNGNRVMGTFWTLLLRSYKGIKSFQVIQDSTSKITIFYTITNKFNNIIISDILRKIHDYGGNDIDVKFIKKEKINVNKAGKMNFIISKVN